MPKKPRRSLSGVVVVAVMAPAFKCPGSCVYCFRGEKAAQSYTGLEPAARRAISLGYNPYRMVTHRLQQLEANGHYTGKVELIVMGGTFNFFPRKFQKWFMLEIYRALNGKPAKSIEEAQKINEAAAHRMVSLTFETRPDFITLEEALWLMDFGMTRIELGVQSPHADILELVRRGHGLKEIKRATALLKDLGLKINYHVMPCLPGSSLAREIEAAEKLLLDADFRPDMLKVYPTLVISGSELFEWYAAGAYRPCSMQNAVRAVAAYKILTPPWVRIMRIMRDVPSNAIDEGPKKSNLRQYVQRFLAEVGLRCRCIRCREVLEEPELNLKLVERWYKASGAWEVFLSFEDPEKDKIAAFLRLRLLKRFLHPNLEEAAVVRELRVYGKATEFGRKGPYQHRGLGRKLMAYAEEIAAAYGYKAVAVTSGVGVRGYFKKLGYTYALPWMKKSIA